MNSQLHQHYVNLWLLLSSLEQELWEEQEKRSLEQLLKDAASGDQNLAHLNPQASDFFDQLSLELQVLIINKPELPPANLPPPEILKEAEQYAQNLQKLEEDIPIGFSFRQEDKKEYPFLSSLDIHSILKKHNLVDQKGNFSLSNPQSVQAAQEEMAFLFLENRMKATYRNALVRTIESGDVPTLLLSKELLGTKEFPGLVDIAAAEIAKKATKEFKGKLKSELGEQPVSLSSKGFFTALQQTSRSLQSTAISLKFIDSPTAEKIVSDVLKNSPTFQFLDTTRQNSLIQALTRSIISTGNALPLSPKRIEDFLIKRADKGIIIEVTPTDAQKGISGKPALKYYSFPSKPKTIAVRVQEELSLPVTAVSTENITRFVEDFSQNPVSATFNYFYFSGVNLLLPGPLKNLYWRKKKTEKLWKTLYAVSINQEAQRKALEALGINAVKAIGKKFGLVNQAGQWLPVAALGWVGEKTVTAIGEGFSNLFSKIPLVGKPLGKIFRKRLGKERKRYESLATGIVGVVFDIASVTVGLIPKLAWRAVNQIPAVKELRNLISEKWVNFRYGLETKIPVFKYIRIAKSTIGGLVKSLPHGLITTGFAYLATGGNLPLSIAFGSTDLLYHFLRNLNTIPELTSWATGSHTTLIGKGISWIMSNKYAYLPIKSPLLSWYVTDAVLPLFGINLPFGLKFLISLASAAAEYGFVTGLKPLISLHISPFLNKWFFGPLGKFFGQGFPGGLLALQLALYFGLPWWQVILAGLGGTTAWYLLAQFLPMLFRLNIFSIPGFFLGSWITTKLGLSGIPGIALPYATGVLTTFLANWGLPALGNWLWATASGLSLPIVGGTGAVAAGITLTATVGTILGVAAVIGVAILVIYILASTFLPLNPELAPPTSECFAPTKIVEILDKNTRQPKQKAEPGDILRYTINFGAKKPEIKNITLIDDFKESEAFVSVIPGQSWEKPYVNPATFSVQAGSEPPGSKRTGPTRITERGSGEPTGYQELWQRVKWENFSITPSTSVLAYEIKVSDNYKGGGIINQILLDGLWSENIDGQEKKAECRVAFTAYVNSSTKEAAQLAVAIINALNKCGISYVTNSRLSQVETCLQKASIPQVAIDEIKKSASIASFGNKLQCIGFINALEAATGGNIQNLSYPNAKSYWRDLPGYQRKYRTPENKNDLRAGDIPIWTNRTDGHITIVVEPVFDMNGELVKIVIAEAMGDTGLVRLRQIVYYDPGFTGWQRRK